MKSTKKLVLVGLVLLASVMVLLPLVGCDTNAGGDKPSNTDTSTQQPSDEGDKPSSTDTSTQQPSGDGGNGTEKHEHSFADVWSTSDTHHWKAATCEHTDEKSGYAEHNFGDWKTIQSPTEETEGSKGRVCVCGVCSYSEENKIEKVPSGFVYIPEGSFQMGSEVYHKPVHEVKISKGFFMGKYEVTQKEYLDVMEKWGGAYEPDGWYGEGDNYPAYYVSWYDAVVYCNKRSLAEGLTPCYTIKNSTDPEDWGAVPTFSNGSWKVICNWDANGYRLPTEAEWEYAARAGNDTTEALIWSGTDKEEELGNYAWYYYNSKEKSHEVGMKYPNAYGLCDMSGNVSEWCWDRYGEKYYSQAESGSDPKGPSSGDSRVWRGSNWRSGFERHVSVSWRDYNHPSFRDNDLGFRVVRASSK